MKLAFWRRAEEDLEPLIEVRTASGTLSAPSFEVAEHWLSEVARHPARVKTGSDLRAELAEVTVERDELLQALDERRPAPDPDQLGRQLQAAWFATEGGERGYRERWTAVAETAIDAVRGLWPTGPIAAEVVHALDDDDPGCGHLQPTAGRRRGYRCSRDLDHRGNHRAALDGRVVATWPAEGPETSPGAPGQRSTPAADLGGLGSSHAPGDTEVPVPAEAPAAGAGGEEAAAPFPAGPLPDLEQLAADVDERLEQLAIRLSVTAGTAAPSTWHLMTPAYREVYRRLATEVALAGWLPPGTGRLAGSISSIAGVLTDHELLVDGCCRCGWVALEIWHPEHVARHLLDEAAIA